MNIGIVDHFTTIFAPKLITMSLKLNYFIWIPVQVKPSQLVLTIVFFPRFLFISSHKKDAEMDAKFCICTLFSGIMHCTSRSNRCV